MGTKWLEDDRLDDLSQTVVQQAHQARHIRRGGVRTHQHHTAKRGYLHAPVGQEPVQEVFDFASPDATRLAAVARR
ncbi:hypothetical protein [Aquabacterium sp.]|uniref:hypothetical protein n=1 Tax=Aquabacterium sp. TaxID=1872578 RepID=UPI0035B44ECB